VSLGGPVAATPAAAPSAGGPDDSSFGERIVGTAVGDRIYVVIITGFAACVPLLLLLVLFEVAIAGWPALSQFGFGFLTSSEWDPVKGNFGAAAAIFGTLVTSILALVIATPLALGVAIFLSEFAPRWLRQPLAFFVDLLAAIPSVVYGLWASSCSFHCCGST